jgi:glycine cleavage system transcriptional repressor
MRAEKRYMVLTAVGPDRQGLVERISALIHEGGANLEDSRMAILGGEFALILLFSGGADAVSHVTQGQAALERDLGLAVTIKETTAQQSGADYLGYQLRVGGLDRPGIVAHISALLARLQVNVAALDSQLSYAPLSGTPMFQLRASLQVPSKLALPSLRSEMSRLCEEENLDFEITFPEGRH